MTERLGQVLIDSISCEVDVVLNEIPQEVVGLDVIVVVPFVETAEFACFWCVHQDAELGRVNLGRPNVEILAKHLVNFDTALHHACRLFLIVVVVTLRG